MLSCGDYYYFEFHVLLNADLDLLVYMVDRRYPLFWLFLHQGSPLCFFLIAGGATMTHINNIL